MTIAAADSGPPGGLCRDCLAPVAAGEERDRCRRCSSPRLLRHPELDALTLAHIDCDAFYASIEKRDKPALADKPLRFHVADAKSLAEHDHQVHSGPRDRVKDTVAVFHRGRHRFVQQHVLAALRSFDCLGDRSSAAACVRARPPPSRRLQFNGVRDERGRLAS